MSKVTIRNNTSSDILVPRMKPQTRVEVRRMLVDGEIVNVEEEVELMVFSEEEVFHIPPTLKSSEPGELRVSEEDIELMRACPAFAHFEASKQIDVYELK